MLVLRRRGQERGQRKKELSREKKCQERRRGRERCLSMGFTYRRRAIDGWLETEPAKEYSCCMCIMGHYTIECSIE